MQIGAGQFVFSLPGDGMEVGLQSLKTHCAPKKLMSSRLKKQMPVSTLYFAVPVHREGTPQARIPCSELLPGTPRCPLAAATGQLEKKGPKIVVGIFGDVL